MKLLQSVIMIITLCKKEWIATLSVAISPYLFVYLVKLMCI